ncbi:hypothetical protein [Paraburkholderia oxyphila]|uniref:hypothetical protein n=1 Tax=Paraburkholderia oxyphila TaxID=614212 RepID=UPI000694FF2A|nr:hypothetical protein [Paraburkholderia oxyphila]
MDKPIANSQIETIMSMLEEAMIILRDDKQRPKNDLVFGNIRKIQKSVFSDYGDEYSFDNDKIPLADITFHTVDDPLNYSDDRSSVALVPSDFTLRFYRSIAGITPEMIAKRLDLADYWIDPDGQRTPNHMNIRVPPNLAQHSYRYRANAHANSRFPVDVEVFYIDSSLDAPQGSLAKLDRIKIRRAYPLVTAEDRERMREEKEQRIRELYGKPEAGK